MDRNGVRYDLAALVTESVDSIKAKFPTISDEQLAELLGLEQARENPRSTLVAAIQGVQESRATEKAEDEARAAEAHQASLAAANAATGGAGGGDAPIDLSGKLGVADITATGNISAADFIATGTLSADPVFTGNVVLAADVTAALQRLGIEPVAEPAAAAAKLNAIADRLDGGVMSQAEIDALLAEQAALHEENVKGLQAALDKAAAQAAKPVSRRAAKARVMKLDLEAGEAFSVVFTGQDDHVVTTLSQLDFDPSHFFEQDGGRLLSQKIELPASTPRCEIARAWLVDESGAAWGVARIGMMPLAFGGGTGAELAAGSLLFRPTSD